MIISLSLSCGCTERAGGGGGEEGTESGGGGGAVAAAVGEGCITVAVAGGVVVVGVTTIAASAEGIDSSERCLGLEAVESVLRGEDCTVM